MPGPDPAREQADRAAAQAGSIGGRASSQPPGGEGQDPAQIPVLQAGGGEAEGFEEAERELVEHASHGDQHSAGAAIEDASDEDEDARAAGDGEADYERTSEREDRDY